MLVPNIVSGFATGLFSIPEGMAYAQLAGVNPVYGLYSRILMMSTLTSAIALSTGSVLQNAGIEGSEMPQALFTITFLVGTIMFVLGSDAWQHCQLCVQRGHDRLCRRGVAAHYPGRGRYLTGYSPTGANQLQKMIDWVVNIAQWETSAASGNSHGYSDGHTEVYQAAGELAAVTVLAWHRGRQLI